jgi:hypothetical protein
MSFAGPGSHDPVNLSMDGRSRHSENWMVFDSGHTLSPNPELWQGKLMHWVEHIAWQTRGSVLFCHRRTGRNPGAGWIQLPIDLRRGEELAPILRPRPLDGSTANPRD